MKVQNLYFAAVLATLTAIQTQAQNTLEKLWETEAQLPVPESVLYSAKEKVLFVAQIDGKPAEKDGVGAIGKVGLDGKIINANWVSGLHAPKGMGIYKSTLYVSDVTDIVEIDLKSGKIIKKHAVEGAKFLNDLTVDSKGNVYVSDSQTKRVNLLKNGVVSIYQENFAAPNGLLAVGTDLLVTDGGKLVKLSKEKQITTIAEGMDKSTDGIEQVKPGEYLVSSWVGVVYYVKSDGNVKELLNTTEAKSNAADIGYDPVKKIVYVPTFVKNSVAAYQLK
jgi:hypothetical protein